MRGIVTLLSLALLSCFGAPPPKPSGAKPLVVACPLGVPATRIRVVDTTEGVDLLFTTTPGATDELRGRVESQAKRNGPEHREGIGHDGRHGFAHEHGLRLWEMPKALASVSDEPGGVKLILVPADPAQRDALREAVIRRVARLEAQGCPD